MHSSVTATFILITLWDLSFGLKEWCSEEYDCNINGAVQKHTMCVNTPKQTVGSFTKITVSTTPHSRIFLLKAHNSYRNTLAMGWTALPAASNMRQMTWDTTLEELATNWGKQCNPGHDSCRTTPQFPSVGQNIIMGAGNEKSQAASSNFFNTWAKEFEENSDETLIKSFKNGSWNRGTQLLWADSTKVGCGEITCHQDPNKFINLLVCNYGPSGNIENHGIYQMGDKCTECKPGTSCKEESGYPNLCALPDDPTNESLGIPKFNSSEGGSTTEFLDAKTTTRPTQITGTKVGTSPSQPTASQTEPNRKSTTDPKSSSLQVSPQQHIDNDQELHTIGKAPLKEDNAVKQKSENPHLLLISLLTFYPF